MVKCTSGLQTLPLRLPEVFKNVDGTFDVEMIAGSASDTEPLAVSGQDAFDIKFAAMVQQHKDGKATFDTIRELTPFVFMATDAQGKQTSAMSTELVQAAVAMAPSTRRKSAIEKENAEKKKIERAEVMDLFA